MSIDRVIWLDRGWQPVDIGFCPTEAAWKRAAKEHDLASRWPDLTSVGAHTEWLRSDSGEGIVLVAIDGKSERDALCRHIGEDAPGIEMEAYGIEAISRGLVDAYCRTLGKGKNWPV